MGKVKYFICYFKLNLHKFLRLLYGYYLIKHPVYLLIYYYHLFIILIMHSYFSLLCAIASFPIILQMFYILSNISYPLLRSYIKNNFASDLHRHNFRLHLGKCELMFATMRCRTKFLLLVQNEIDNLSIILKLSLYLP